MAKKKRVIHRKSRKAIKGFHAKPGRASYSVRALSSKSHRTIRTFITDIENHIPEIDSLKPIDAAWGAEIFGYKTYKLYGSIGDLAKQLASYNLAEEHPKDSLKEIKVIKVGVEDFSQWNQDKKFQIEESIRNRKLKGKKFRQYKRQAEKKEKAAQVRAKKMRAKIRQLENKLKQSRSRKPAPKRKRKNKKNWLYKSAISAG